MEGPDTTRGTPAQETASAAAGSEDGGSPSTVAAPPAPAPPAPGTKRRKRPTRTGVIILVVVLVLAAAVGGVAYFRYASRFVTTDNAQVDGDKVQINAPATGTLTGWAGQQGATVRTGQILGRIKIDQGFSQPLMLVKSPGNGTIAVNLGVEGQWVTSGTQLATAYDFNKIYVTARVDETDIAGVHLGAPVDLAVDAFSGAPVTGVVTDIQGAAANQLAMFPEENTNGDFQKVTQVIAVRVAFTNTVGQRLVPGMNVTVHIHKSR